MFKASLWSGHLPVSCAAAFGPEVSDCVDHETKRILGGARDGGADRKLSCEDSAVPLFHFLSFTKS